MIEEGTWIRPTKGKVNPQTHYLCVSDPYRDPEEQEKQKEYWKEKYDVELEDEKLVKVQLFTEIMVGERRENSPARVISFTDKPYIFPVECLEEDSTQVSREIIEIEEAAITFGIWVARAYGEEKEFSLYQPFYNIDRNNLKMLALTYALIEREMNTMKRELEQQGAVSVYEKIKEDLESESKKEVEHLDLKR